MIAEKFGLQGRKFSVIMVPGTELDHLGAFTLL